jgi:hypothetical protein
VAPRLVALLAVAALLGAGVAHLVHAHPHRTGQELSCVVCQTPIGEAVVTPALAPPAPLPALTPAPTREAPRSALAPLSFSPKQSPPASA